MTQTARILSVFRRSPRAHCAALALALAACGGGASGFLVISFGGPPPSSAQPGAQPQFHFLNAAGGSGLLDAKVDGQVAASSVDFGQDSPWAQFDAGSRTLTALSSGSAYARATVVFSAVSGHRLSALAYWPALAYANATPSTNAASLPMAAIVVDDPYSDGAPPSGTTGSAGLFRVRFANLACAVGPVDAYLLPAGGMLAGAAPAFSNVSCGAASPASGQNSLPVVAGPYEIVLTNAGLKTVVYDSGGSAASALGSSSASASAGVAFTAGADYVLAAAPSRQPGSASQPLSVIVAVSSSSSSQALPDQSAVAPVSP